MPVLAVIATLLYGLLGAWLLLCSIHGPSSLYLAGPIYAGFAIALTWYGCWRWRREDGGGRWWKFGGTILLLVALGPALLPLAEAVESWERSTRIAATRIREVRDEPLQSEGGRTIGVRVSFSVEVPRRGGIGVLPVLASAGERERPYLLLDDRRVLSGDADERGRLRSRTPYRLQFDLVPPGLHRNQKGERCVFAQSLVAAVAREPAPLALEVGESRYRGVTLHRYDIGSMIEAARAESYPSCPW